MGNSFRFLSVNANKIAGYDKCETFAAQLEMVNDGGPVQIH